MLQFYFVDARVLNYGTRIDYIFADLKFGLDACDECVVLQDMEGSDHCPVKATFNCELLPCKRYPPLCTKYMPEFTGKQQKLDLYFKIRTTGVKANNGNENLQSEHKRPKDSSSEQSSSVQNQRTTPMKRQIPDPHKGNVAKKLKKGNKQLTSSKQSNLMAFFSSQNSKQETISDRIHESIFPSSVNSAGDGSGDGSNSRDNTEGTDNAERTDSVINEPKSTRDQTVTVNPWKNLLKPRPPPLCKGHNIPCVARTVKKDGPNKGRIFYVCTKPDGPKTNPEARCEHFEWLDKKKR